MQAAPPDVAASHQPGGREVSLAHFGARDAQQHRAERSPARRKARHAGDLPRRAAHQPVEPPARRDRESGEQPPAAPRAHASAARRHKRHRQRSVARR